MKKINKENIDEGSSKNKNRDIKFVSNKRRRPVDDNTKNLRRLYNQLMQKETKKKINKIDIVNKVIKMINGNYSEFCYKHDGCRILQGSIKYGNRNQRKELIKNLKQFMYDLVIKKYSIFLAIKIYKFSEKQEREDIIKETILPNFNKLLKTQNGQAFLNFVFSNSTSKIRDQFVLYYIEKILKISYDRIKNQNISKEPSDPSNDVIIVEKQGTYDQENVRELLKAHLEKQLERNIHKVHVFQGFLNQIFDYLDTKSKTYLAELFDDDINEFFGNRQGVELSCKLFNVASTKTRKKIIKKIKDNLSSIINNDTSILFLIKVILSTDDTKLIHKHILSALVEKMNEELMQNPSLLKVFMNIIVPFNPKCNKQDEQKILQNDDDSSSKKDQAKRIEELTGYVIDDVLNYVNVNMRFFIMEPTYSNLLVDLVETLSDDKVESVLKNLHDVINFDYLSNYDDLNSLIITDNTGHFNIMKVLKVITKNMSDVKMNFCKNISDILLKNIDGFMDTKAIFIIIRLLETEQTNKLLAKEVKKYKTKITEKAKEPELKGYQILSKIVK